MGMMSHRQRARSVGRDANRNHVASVEELEKTRAARAVPYPHGAVLARRERALGAGREAGLEYVSLVLPERIVIGTVPLEGVDDVARYSVPELRRVLLVPGSENLRRKSDRNDPF